MRSCRRNRRRSSLGPVPGVRWAIIEQVVAVISNDGLRLTKYVLHFIANIIFESVHDKLSPA